MNNQRISSGVRFALLAIVVSTIGLASGCAKPVEEARPIPADPFPRWVSTLEVGRTEMEQVLEAFGDPREIEDSQTGGAIWRYSHPEILWPSNHPSRPQVAADGTVGPPRVDPMEQARDLLSRGWKVVDALIFYPPSRPKEPVVRRLPATIHELEVAFNADGVVDRYRYAPRLGSASAPTGR